MAPKRKKSTRKSPLPMASPSPSPISPTPPKSTIKRSKAKQSPEPAAKGSSLHLNSVSDLRELVSSRLRDLKSNLIDRSHSEILNDLDASRSRLHRRLKIQTQACQQVMDESEKEYKKMLDRITESCEATKESFEEFLADVQATTSRVCKTTISDLSKSFEKSISVLHGRYGIPSI